MKNLKHFIYRARHWVSKPRVVRSSKPVILSDEDRCKNPIFLIGVHRSGTSLLRRIFNSHKNIACPPETVYLSYFARMLDDQGVVDGLSGFGYEGKELDYQIGIWASRFHEAYRIAEGKRRWADKTPQYTEILPALERMYGQGCNYVMLFRNPLDILYSMTKREWRFGAYHEDLLVNNAMYIREAIGRMKDFIDEHQERCSVLCYEKLVVDPDGELRRVFTEVGEDWDPGVLEFNKKSHGYGLEDPIVAGTRKFHKNFGNWKGFKEDEIQKVMPILRNLLQWYDGFLS